MNRITVQIDECDDDALFEVHVVNSIDQTLTDTEVLMVGDKMTFEVPEGGRVSVEEVR